MSTFKVFHPLALLALLFGFSAGWVEAAQFVTFNLFAEGRTLARRLKMYSYNVRINRICGS